MRNYLLLIYCAILCSMCQENTSQLEKRLFKEYTKKMENKVIILPENLQQLSGFKDTICPDLLDREYKIVVYVDSLNCTVCQLRLSEWRELIQETEKKKMNVSFLFYVYAKNYKELSYEMVSSNFTYPVYIDKENDLVKLNKLSTEILYRSLLVDKNNRVLLVGNPTVKSNIWHRYKAKILR